jgi:branched-chain amino acid aminotransferase
MLAILDGTVLPVSEARIPVTDDGLLRGDAVFEVIRLYGGLPFALDDHLARMERSAHNLRLPFDVDAVRADVAALLEGGRPGDGVLRVLVTRGGRRIGFIEPLPVLPPTLSLRTVTYTPTRILDGVKSLSYGANMLASRLAREQGADEALLVTPHGRVLEAPTSSIFWVGEDGALSTPPLDDHILASITRDLVLKLVDVREAPLTQEELLGAREAFLCSTTREVQPVAAVEDTDFGEPGERTLEARAALREHISGALG